MKKIHYRVVRVPNIADFGSIIGKDFIQISIIHDGTVGTCNLFHKASLEKIVTIVT